MVDRLEKPPYSGGPTYMSRTPGKSKTDAKRGGDLRPPDRAGYGLAQGVEPNSLKGTISKNTTNNGFKLTAEGPGRTSSSEKGGVTRTGGRTYGVGGAEGGHSGGPGYGTKGI